MSYILVTTRRTLENPTGEMRYLVSLNTESFSRDAADAYRFKDRDALNAAHRQLRNPSNWDALPLSPAHPELVEGRSC
jgi:hypothetical protein